MKISEYASDVNLSVAEILKKCHELAINVNNKDDYLTDDDIIMLDNTINLISTDDEITFEDFFETAKSMGITDESQARAMFAGFLANQNK